MNEEISILLARGCNLVMKFVCLLLVCTVGTHHTVESKMSLAAINSRKSHIHYAVVVSLFFFYLKTYHFCVHSQHFALSDQRKHMHMCAHIHIQCSNFWAQQSPVDSLSS